MEVLAPAQWRWHLTAAARRGLSPSSCAQRKQRRCLVNIQPKCHIFQLEETQIFTFVESQQQHAFQNLHDRKWGGWDKPAPGVLPVQCACVCESCMRAIHTRTNCCGQQMTKPEDILMIHHNEVKFASPPHPSCFQLLPGRVSFGVL